jgi:hypothetical protein
VHRLCSVRGMVLVGLLCQNAMHLKFAHAMQHGLSMGLLVMLHNMCCIDEE